jgi:hypothetical protein
MLKLFSPLAIAGAFALPFLGAAPALAASPVTFVSGKGADTGTCASPATPCRTFQFAFGQTSPGGEIKALDPAPYGPVTITNSISITGVEGASINRASGDHITINAGPNDTINLSHLTLDGFRIASLSKGIVLNSGGSLTISHCTVRNFKQNGILLEPSGATRFLITDTLVSDNSFAIAVVPQAAGTAQGTLDHVLTRKNDLGGVGMNGPSTVLAVDSTASDNTGPGFSVSFGAVLRLAHSAATGNATGVSVGSGGTAESAGNNFIRGNGTDVSGTLTNVGTK